MRRPSSKNEDLECVTKENTLERFEKLIQQTQRSDESSLLRHIQRNLEQLQSAGNIQSKFAQLQQ